MSTPPWRSSAAARRDRLRPVRARRRSPRPWPASARSATSSSPPSTATTNTIRDYDIDRAIRLVTLKLVGYTEVVHVLLRPADDDALDRAVRRAWPRSGRIPVRRRSRRSTAASSGLTRTLVEELTPIRVNAIHPGDRRRQPVLGRQAAGRGELHVGDADRPAGEMADIVGAVAFLLENPSVNGVDLIVDGGWHCR